jgi:NADH-quinone oxidoreductase subunit H
MSALLVNLFLGGWLSPFGLKGFVFDPLLSIWFSIKLVTIIILFCVIRAGLPRYRYDQLMTIGWKMLLPLALASLLFYTGLMKLFEINLLVNK